jgi:predicted PurR-regulated permease PerM
MDSGNEITISWVTLWRVVAMLVLVVALFLVREVVVLVFIAVVLSSAIYAPVRFLEKKGIPRTLSVMTIFLLSAALIGLVLYALVPVALIQFQFLLDNVNQLKTPLLEVVGASDLIAQLEHSITSTFDTILAGGSAFFNFLSKFLGNVFFVAVALVLSFYLSISKKGVERFLRAILPKAQEQYAINLFVRTRRKLGRWLGGQLILSILVGGLTFIGLAILGVEYALALGVLAAILELVPYVGPIAIGVIAFLVSLPQSLATALLVVLITFIIQQLENNLLVPLVMSKAVDTDPVVVVIALLAGVSLAGLVGMILAVPATIVIQEFIDDWSEKKQKTVEAVTKEA